MTKPFYIFAPAGDSVTFIVEGRPYLVANDNPRYLTLVDAIKTQAWDTINEIVTASERFTRILGAFGDVVVYNGHVTFKNEEIHSYLVDKILAAAEDGFPIEPLGRFMENVKKNPDPRTHNDLYRWCEASKLPLTEDGCFIAYKTVRLDYMDQYTGTFDHHPGLSPEMRREDCNPDPNITCSTGLHFCGASYLGQYGGGNNGHSRVLLVKVNPADVTAFPTDYQLQKGRCCKYEVVQEIDPAVVGQFYEGWKGYFVPVELTDQQRAEAAGYVVVKDSDDDYYVARVDGVYMDSEFYDTSEEAWTAAAAQIPEPVVEEQVVFAEPAPELILTPSPTDDDRLDVIEKIVGLPPAPGLDLVRRLIRVMNHLGMSHVDISDIERSLGLGL